MLPTELNIADIPKIFIRFKDVIDERFWFKREKLISSEICGHKYLESYLLEENALIFQLAELSRLVEKYGWIPRSQRKNKALYPAISFAAQVLSLLDIAPENQKNSLVGRIRGSFKNPEDLRAIQLELTAATNFIRRGCAVKWPEMEKTGTFDLLVDDIATNGLEVECKSISRDMGRKITKRKALEFFELARPSVQSELKNTLGGIVVVLTIPEKLPTKLEEKTDLIKSVVEGLGKFKTNLFLDNSLIRISKFDLKLIKDVNFNSGDPLLSRELVDQITSTENQEVMIVGNSSSAIVLVVKSEQDNSLLEYIFKTVNDSSKRQLSKQRSAIYLIGLQDIEPSELVNIANQDFDSRNHPTGLRIAVSNFFAKENRDYLVGIGFLSKGILDASIAGEAQESGTVYFFSKKESNFWHDDLSNLFSREQAV